MELIQGLLKPLFQKQKWNQMEWNNCIKIRTFQIILKLIFEELARAEGEAFISISSPDCKLSRFSVSSEGIQGNSTNTATLCSGHYLHDKWGKIILNTIGEKPSSFRNTWVCVSVIKSELVFNIINQFKQPTLLQC